MFAGMHDSEDHVMRTFYARDSMNVARSSDGVLADALHDLRVARTRYCRTELRVPWGLEIPAADMILFHFVASGTPHRIRGGSKIPPSG